MVIKNIGILYETLEDAQKIKNKPLRILSKDWELVISYWELATDN